MTPALMIFEFKGVIEYLEDLVTYIDAPRLGYFKIAFFNQIDFDGPRLAQFISRAPGLEDYATLVQFDDSSACVTSTDHSAIIISCREPDWQLSSVAQVCNTCLPPLSTIEHLFILNGYSELLGYDVSEDTLWLELLLPFPAVTNLYLPEYSAPGIVAALQEMVGAEVLPSLQNIFVEGLEPSGPFQEDIREFVTARQLSGHPISFFVWDGFPSRCDVGRRLV